MSTLQKAQGSKVDVFDRFNRLFDEWVGPGGFRWGLLPAEGVLSDQMIRVDEFRENGNLVVRAELPGIDPDKDVELSISEGMLVIEAHRREEDKQEERGYVRRELRYGSFMRTLPLPEGVTEKDVRATYKDGILEIKVPAPVAKQPEAKKIEIKKIEIKKH